MRFDLKKPCKNCPFVDGPDRITFSCVERAKEIEEQAYRGGFVCHVHGESVEEEDDPVGGGGIYERRDGSSQHCFGALAMHIQHGGSTVPWEQAIEDDDELEERWWNRVNMEALATVFEDEDAFFEANQRKPYDN
jgi:hypothetical protein